MITMSKSYCLAELEPLKKDTDKIEKKYRKSPGKRVSAASEISYFSGDRSVWFTWFLNE